MKDTFKLIGVLTLICLISGILLSFVNARTEEPIRKAMRAEQMAALMKVLPACDNTPDQDTVTVTENGVAWTFYLARKGGEFAGAAFKASSSRGYGGEIQIMVGVDASDTVRGIEILKQTETPGLGAKIAGEPFKKLFAGRSVRDTRWAVSKDKGDIDQITAATISSRAVVGAVKSGLDVYLKHRDAIAAPPAAAAAPTDESK